MEVEGEPAQTPLERDCVALGLGVQEQLGLERRARRRGRPWMGERRLGYHRTYE